MMLLQKKITDNQQHWDLYLNRALAAIRFNISVSSKFSPFFLLNNRDVVLPVDNLMKPRRKYQGEETHKISLEEQHKNFVLVMRQEAKYADQGSKHIDYGVCDTVYYKNQRMQNKLDARWKPFHRIIAKRGPRSYFIQNQLDGSTIKAHAVDLNPVNLEEWDIPCTKDSRSMRRAANAIPPEESSLEDDDSEPDKPLRKVIRRHRRER